MKLLVIGASGHAKDVVSLARELGYTEFVLATTDGGDGFWGVEEIMIGDDLEERFGKWDAFVAIGENSLRRGFMERFPGLSFVSLCAPSAQVSEEATLGSGCYVGHHVYVGPDTDVGDGVVLNVAAVVGHDCRLGAFSQVCPRAVVLGNVSLGEEAFLGAACVINRGGQDEPLLVAPRVSVGMGCAVFESILEDGVRLLPKPNVVAVGSMPG